MVVVVEKFEKLSQKLDIPFYDHKLVELAANSSLIDQDFFENSDMYSILYD